MQYLVQWEIDIEADTPEDAAKEALEIMRDLDSEAQWFDVIQLSTNEMTQINLLANPDEEEMPLSAEEVEELKEIVRKEKQTKQ